ncbi:uncharacterized protein BJ171DRAFT_569980 [Polychytrium aggregatum]|uniref:uncharacterized protein n=1 Tax=Polychytrium aggregatum TaxID=110093 RepID=UPI0022FE87AF|nr:uncharacterized protein BJ171DRAFT_569980 [Polychytrium aggregatum]KAI9201921.1 hypothetical protein BJ171DRAFT_569980 [Polychytrium aggregatum]
MSSQDHPDQDLLEGNAVHDSDPPPQNSDTDPSHDHTFQPPESDAQDPARDPSSIPNADDPGPSVDPTVGNSVPVPFGTGTSRVADDGNAPLSANAPTQPADSVARVDEDELDLDAFKNLPELPPLPVLEAVQDVGALGLPTATDLLATGINLPQYTVDSPANILAKFGNQSGPDSSFDPDGQDDGVDADGAIGNAAAEDEDDEDETENELMVPAIRVNIGKSTMTRQDDDDEDEDEDEDSMILDPDNPLMRRVQDALEKQLTQQLLKVEMELKDKEESVRKATKRREEIGVELYAVQQQLARLQAVLESAEDNFDVIRSYREEAERHLKHTSAQHKEEKDKYLQHQRSLEQHKHELEKISRTLQQVDLYNEELRSKILVAKRTTLKAEEDITNQEIEKKRQDYFIDHLTDQLRKLQEKRVLYDNQYLAQQKETHAAIETLQEASTEMEAIQFEKRQLIHQWKSSLIGLQRRQDVLQQIEQGIQTSKDQIQSMVGEINGFKLSLRRAQEESETVTMLLAKLEGEVNFLKKQIGIVGENKEKLKDTYMVYTKSLGQTEQELAQVMQERQALQLEVGAIQKLTQQTIAATQKIESEIAESLQNQISIEKGASGARKDGSKLRAIIHEKEAQIAATQNETSNIRLDTLSVSSRIATMKDQVVRIDGEMADKNNLIEKYEVEIRRRNDELGKKQSEMDLLNKKFDQLMARNQDESVGPLEATIHNVTKLVAAKEKECTMLQQYWLRAQNELVSMSKQSAELIDETQDLKMKMTVLSRKKMVVNNQFETEEKAIREHKRNIGHLQNEQVKVNILLSKQAHIQSLLEESTLDLEQEFRANLKAGSLEAELESIRLEKKADDLVVERDKALQGLVEAERQMMLWEKKIQLAKETKAALDPNIGATEIKEMGIEIHRMKLRYASMLKLQEKMIAEMEKSVFRRETIASRTKTKGKGGGQMSLQKAIADLTKKTRQTMNDVKECDRDIESLLQSHQRITSDIQDVQQECVALEQKESRLLQEVEQCFQDKQLFTNLTLLHQKQVRRYQELKESKYQYLCKTLDARTAELSRQEERLQKLEAVVKLVENECSSPLQLSVAGITRLISEATVKLLQ